MPTFSSQLFGDEGARSNGNASRQGALGPQIHFETAENLINTKENSTAKKEIASGQKAFDFGKKSLGQNIQIEVPKFDLADHHVGQSPLQAPELQQFPSFASAFNEQIKNNQPIPYPAVQEQKPHPGFSSQSHWVHPWNQPPEQPSQWNQGKPEHINSRYGFQGEQIMKDVGHSRENGSFGYQDIHVDNWQTQYQQPATSQYQSNQRPTENQAQETNFRSLQSGPQTSEHQQPSTEPRKLESRDNLSSQIMAASQQQPAKSLGYQQNSDIQVHINSKDNFSKSKDGSPGLPPRHQELPKKPVETQPDPLALIQSKLDQLEKQKSRENAVSQQAKVSNLPPMSPLPVANKPQNPPNPVSEPQLSGPMAEREKMFRKSATPFTVTTPPPPKEIVEQTKILAEKRTRESAKAPISAVKEPFFEEINIKYGQAGQSIAGPYKDKKTRTSAKDNMDAKVKLIQSRRAQEEMATGGAGNKVGFEKLVEGTVPGARPDLEKAKEPIQHAPTQQPAKITQAAMSPAKAESQDAGKAVQIVYQQLNGKNYPVRIDSTVLSPSEKQMLLKHLLEKEGMSLEEVEDLQRESDIHTMNKNPSLALEKTPEKPISDSRQMTPSFPVETLTSAEAKRHSGRELEFEVAPISDSNNFLEKRYNSLLTNVQDEIINEEEEGASKSSRRESIYIGDTDSIDLNPKEPDLNVEPTPNPYLGDMKTPPHIDLKKKPAEFDLGFTAGEKFDSLAAFGKKSDPFAGSSDNLSLAALLKRNEEMMRLISEDVGDLTDVAEPKPVPSIKKAGRGMKNNLSEKYKSGQINLGVSSSSNEELSNGDLSGLKGVDCVNLSHLGIYHDQWPNLRKPEIIRPATLPP
jgi:hypothetical protein